MGTEWPGSEKALGTALARIREELGLKQEDIARRIGISDALVGFYENGTRPIKVEHLRKWLVALERPQAWADELIDWNYRQDFEKLLDRIKPPLSQEQRQAQRTNFESSLLLRRRREPRAE